MTVNFCARCGMELGNYEGWRVMLHFDNDSRPPRDARASGLICGDCVAPALQVIRDVESGAHRLLRFKAEVAA